MNDTKRSACSSILRSHKAPAVGIATLMVSSLKNKNFCSDRSLVLKFPLRIKTMFAGEDKPTKIRNITGTFKYCNSGTQEVRTVTCLFDERSEYYELTKVYVVEFGCKLIFSKSDNEFLVND